MRTLKIIFWLSGIYIPFIAILLLLKCSHFFFPALIVLSFYVPLAIKKCIKLIRNAPNTNI